MACCRFAANAGRLQLHALAYNLANFLRTLALPDEVKQWSMTTLRERLVKVGAMIVVISRKLVAVMLGTDYGRFRPGRLSQLYGKCRLTSGECRLESSRWRGDT